MSSVAQLRALKLIASWEVDGDVTTSEMPCYLAIPLLGRISYSIARHLQGPV
jgi:hypothetical protein